MEFGIEKCALLVMKRDNIFESYDIILPGDKMVRNLKEDDSYKYLGVQESGTKKTSGMKKESVEGVREE